MLCHSDDAGVSFRGCLECHQGAWSIILLPCRGWYCGAFCGWPW